MPAPTSQPKPFETPEAVATRTNKQFITTYTNELAIALKQSWDGSKMQALGFPAKPTDAQFTAYANQLINEEQITPIGANGAPGTPITISTIQNNLSSEARSNLHANFGIDNLNDIILNRQELNATGQQLGEASKGHRGQFEALGGATIMDMIMGFLTWLIEGISNGFNFERGADGGLGSGIQNVIKRQATDGAAQDAEQLLASDGTTKGINADMRNYIVHRYHDVAQQETGLAPKTPERRLEDVEIGSGVTQQAAPAVQMNPNASEQDRVKSTVTQIGDRFLQENVTDESIKPAAALLRGPLIDIGTQVVLENKNAVQQGDITTLSNAYADKVMANADAKKHLTAIITQKLGPVKDDAELKQKVALLAQMQFTPNLANLQSALSGQATAQATAPSNTAQPQANPVEAVVANSIIPVVKSRIKQAAVDGVLEQHSNWRAINWFKSLSTVSDDVRTVQSRQGDVNGAKERIYAHTVKLGYAPNEPQSDMIAQSVNQAVQSVISNPENASITQNEMATRIEKAISIQLVKNRASIDAVGTFVLGDNIEKIAKESADAVRNNTDNMYKKLQAAQGMFSATRAQQVVANANRNPATSSTLENPTLVKGVFVPGQTTPPGNVQLAHNTGR